MSRHPITGSKIAIIGCPGSGKSTLSVKLGAQLNLPVFHLDDPYHNGDWPKEKVERRAAWRAYQQELIDKPEWIIDGNYKSTLDMRVDAADTVIFLNFNRGLCLWRIAKRRLHQLRGGTAAGANPERAEWSFLMYVWNFRKTETPKILEALNTRDGQTWILSNPKEVDTWLRKFNEA